MSFITIDTTVELNTQYVLSEISSEDMIHELALRGDIIDVLDYIGIEAMQEFVKANGGFTLENAPVEDLQGALEARGVKPNFPAPITDALNVLFDYFNGEGVIGARVAS